MLAHLALIPLAPCSLSAPHHGAGGPPRGAVAETAFRPEPAVALRAGEGVAFAGRRITLVEIGEVEGPNYAATRANFRIDSAGGARIVAAERRFYPTSPMPTTEVGIASSFDGDIYIALGDAVRGDAGAWAVRLYHNPLVQLIFLGAAMMALGGALSLLALARRRRAET
jgi:cytochrome c-type biogenesis protein CcmF